MKLPVIFILLLGLAGPALAATPAAAKSAQIRQQIDALLKRRQRPEPLPPEPPSPFALVAVVPGGPGQSRDVAATPVEESLPVAVNSPAVEGEPRSTAELLARLAARLRITGIIRLKDQVNIIINDSPWKEGDYLIINHAGSVVRLQILRIMHGQLTLRLDEAEMVLRF